MEPKPIHIAVSPKALFGELYDELIKRHERVVEEAFADDVIDQADFDRYDSDSKEYKFLRRFYYHLRRFSELDGRGDTISRREARSFCSWINQSGEPSYPPLLPLRATTMSGVLRDDLACDSVADSYGECEEPIPIEGARLMIVTHPTASFDENMTSGVGIDEEVALAHADGTPVIYLVQAWDKFDNFYLNEVLPTHFVRSHSGLHSIRFDGNSAVLAGGYFQYCFRSAFRELLKRRTTDRPLTVEIPMDAVYVRTGEGFESTSLASIVQSVDDPMWFLYNQVTRLIEPAPGDLETDGEPINEGYDVAFCYEDTCTLSHKSSPDAPDVTVVFR